MAELTPTTVARVHFAAPEQGGVLRVVRGLLTDMYPSYSVKTTFVLDYLSWYEEEGWGDAPHPVLTEKGRTVAVVFSPSTAPNETETWSDWDWYLNGFPISSFLEENGSATFGGINISCQLIVIADHQFLILWNEAGTDTHVEIRADVQAGTETNYSDTVFIHMMGLPVTGQPDIPVPVDGPRQEPEIPPQWRARRENTDDASATRRAHIPTSFQKRAVFRGNDVNESALVLLGGIRERAGLMYRMRTMRSRRDALRALELIPRGREVIGILSGEFNKPTGE